MENIEQKLKILGDPQRFKIIKLLLGHNLCVGALAQHLGISKPAISQHLQVLRKAGLVKGEKRGYWTHYIVEREILKEMANALVDMAQQTTHDCGDGYCELITEIKKKPG
ncbi:MAG: winged helix-turn-helix transcriptional regulator [Deltaproteobacteria bacterium]|nr:winged helix-turn-helix transcriptional regulator [Deltaproteobacteria bacterium]